MEKLHDAGKARAIGVSNFASKKLGDLLALARIPPAVDQVECHPGWQQTKLHSFCQSKGVHLSVSLLSNYIFLPVKVLACEFTSLENLVCVLINRLVHFAGVLTTRFTWINMDEW
jgi:hypothetical protein